MFLFILPLVHSQVFTPTPLEEFTVKFPDQFAVEGDGAEFRSDIKLWAVRRGQDTGNDQVIFYDSNFITSDEIINLSDTTGQISNEGFAWNGTHYVGTDGFGQRLYFWDISGNLINNVSIESPIEPALHYNGSDLLGINGNLVVSINTNNGSFTPLFFATAYGFSYGSMTQVNGKIYIGHTDGDVLGEYLNDGTPTGLNVTVDNPSSGLQDNGFINGLANNGTHMYISNANQEYSRLFDTNLNDLKTIPSSTGGVPRDIALKNDKIYFVTDDFNQNVVYELDSNGQFTGFYFDVSVQGTGTRGLTIKDNDFFVTDDNKDAVFRYDSNGNFVEKFNISTNFTGQVRGITWDGANFWIKDGSNIVSKFDENIVWQNFSIDVSVATGNNSLNIVSVMPFEDKLWMADFNSNDLFELAKDGSFTGRVIDLSQTTTLGGDILNNILYTSFPNFQGEPLIRIKTYDITNITTVTPVNLIQLSLDIKPQSCPNPLNVKSKGVLPVAILGSNDLDVTKVNQSTIILEGITPLRSSFEDVATPRGDLACTEEGPDGFVDLALKFDIQEIVQALGTVTDELELQLNLTGSLFNGTLIKGEDIVIIKNKGKN